MSLPFNGRAPFASAFFREGRLIIRMEYGFPGVAGSAAPVFRGDVIESTGVERVAPGYAQSGKAESRQQAVYADRLNGVLRAGGIKAATRPQQGRYEPLIYP